MVPESEIADIYSFKNSIMNNQFLKGGTLVNENTLVESDTGIKNGRIAQITHSISQNPNEEILDTGGLHIFQRILESKTHCRKPKFTHSIKKESIYSHCVWSRISGQTRQGQNIHTFVNKRRVFSNGEILSFIPAMAIGFNLSTI